MPDDQIAKLHERLDSALASITAVRESGSADAHTIARLVRQEKALRYQVGQLRTARPAAADDLTSGLELSLSELDRQLANLNPNQ